MSTLWDRREALAIAYHAEDVCRRCGDVLARGFGLETIVTGEPRCLECGNRSDPAMAAVLRSWLPLASPGGAA